MYYKIIDNKKEKWILLIHCICSNMHIFDEYISSLSKEYNVLIVDLPGHGMSKEYENGINCELIANDICEILYNLNIQKISIWSISLGAIVTKYIIRLIPEKVEKVYFEAPALGIDNKFYLFLFKIFNKIKIIIPRQIYLHIFIYFILIGKKRKSIRKIMYEHLKNANKKTVAKYLDNMLEEYLKKDYSILNNSKTNKEFIIGSKDYLFYDAIINNIKENSYNKIIVLDDIGHLCHLETRINI